ncbi:MAG: response regulator [Anaerolineaceae bacterium]|nr:response regulator [Anaerolineaceae bacterium]
MSELKILIVEDEMIVAEDTKDILEGLNYTVVDIASSGEEAIQQVEKLQPDLVLMDINLKGELDGVQAAEQIHRYFDTPVIYVTAYADPQTLQRAKVTAPYGYILKPFKVKELLSVIEITLYKHQTDRKLKESEQWFSTTLSSIGDAVIATDNEGCVTFMNPVAEALTGWSQAEAQGKKLATVFEIINEETGQPAPNPVEQVLKEKRIVTLANHSALISKQGQHIPIEDSAAPILDNKGNINGVVLVFHDITDRRQKEAELTRYREHLETMVQERTAQLTEVSEMQRLILANVDEIVYMVASDKAGTFAGNVRFVSDRVERIIGYHPDEFIEDKNLWFKSIHPDDIHTLVESTERIMFDKRPGTREYRMRHKDTGEYYWMEDRITPQFDADGAVIGLFGVARDISERKHAEEERRRLELQIRQTQKMEAIGTLAGGIAHDFNNLLTPVLGYSEMLQYDFSEGSLTRKKVDAIYQAGARAKELINQILTFSRQVELAPRPVQIDLLLKEALNFLRASLPSTIELEIDIHKNCVVLADPSQIHQIIMNLCTNAYQAMGEKGGVLRVALKPVEINPGITINNSILSAGVYQEFTVSDTGPGIAPAIQQRMFDPFFTTKPVNKGTGLGLSVVLGIVETLNGAITVESELGKGATFKVYLPRYDKPTVPDKPPGMAVTGGKEHILLVDDDAMILEVINNMLTDFGYSVTTKIESAAALETFRNQPDLFDLVITDQIMPNIAGGDLAWQLLQIRADIPIILMTGFSEDMTPDKASDLGIKDYVAKPISLSTLMKTVREVLD